MKRKLQIGKKKTGLLIWIMMEKLDYKETMWILCFEEVSYQMYIEKYNSGPPLLKHRRSIAIVWGSIASYRQQSIKSQKHSHACSIIKLQIPTHTQRDASMGVKCSACCEADLCVSSLTLWSGFCRGVLMSCPHVLFFPPTLRGELIMSTLVHLSVFMTGPVTVVRQHRPFRAAVLQEAAASVKQK